MKTYRTWYIPQVPGEPLYVYFDTAKEASTSYVSMVKLSIFEYENNIKPDYSDA